MVCSIVDCLVEASKVATALRSQDVAFPGLTFVDSFVTDTALFVWSEATANDSIASLLGCKTAVSASLAETDFEAFVDHFCDRLES